MPYGWTGKVLKVDLTGHRYEIENVLSYAESFIGGRGINVKIIYDHIGATVSPFDPDNMVCISPGALTGSPVPSSSRSTITAMSPRGLLDSSGIGGFVGAEIRFAGYDTIVVQGKSDKPVYLYITNDSVEIKDASRLWGKDPWQTQQLIREELGDRSIQSLSIGQAGENLVHFACVITGRLQSAAGRCGMGAIMGSKNLKAIAVRGKAGITLAQPDKFLEASFKMHQYIRESDTFEKRRGCVSDKSYYKMYLDGGRFVTGNWEESKWLEDGFGGLLEDSDVLWQKEAQHLQPNGAQQPGCFGCPMYHETYFKVPNANDIAMVKCLEWLLAGKAWLTSRKDVIEAAHLCNKYGLDVISTGNCIAFLMELYHQGIISKADTDGMPMTRGNLSAVKFAIEKIAHQEGLGKYFKKGVHAAAQSLDVDADTYAMQIKGLELVPIEIRIFKSMALLASVGKVEQLSVIEYYGGDHPESMGKLAEETLGKRDLAIPTAYKDKALLATDTENKHCIGDITGICKWFIPWGPTQSYGECVHLLSLATGTEFGEDALQLAANRTLLLERAFNVIRGIRRKDDRPPKRLFEKSVSDGQYKGELLDKEKYETMLTEYYELRGCDHEGIPTHKSFTKLDLQSEWDRFEVEMENKRNAS